MEQNNRLYRFSKTWGCKEEERKILILFVQRMRELLLHTSSLLTRPYVASPFVIAREILFSLRQHKITPHTSTEANIKLLLDELTTSLQDDEVSSELLGERFPHMKKSILNFNDLNSQIETAQYLKGKLSLNLYIPIFSERITSIIEGDGKEKNKLIKLSEGFISCIKEAGYPTQTIYHLLNISFFDREKVEMTAKQRLERFFSYFDFQSHPYTIYFAISDLALNVSNTFKSIGATYLEGGAKDTIDFLEKLPFSNKSFFDKDKYSGIVRFDDLLALDPHSARMTAEKRLRLLDDLLRFSVHRRRFTIENQAIVSRNKDGRFVNSNRPRASILLVPHDPDVGHEGLNDLALALKNSEVGSLQRFVRAIELHGTALSAHEEESQLLNIWIAFETLFARGATTSKIKEIIDCVELYIIASWIRYDFAELFEKIKTHHIKKWNDFIAANPLLKNLPEFLQFSAAISIRDFEESLTDFLKSLDHDPLLRNKIFCCIKWCQNSKNIKKHIDKIKTKISYDLNRIYRTRNQIVHTGGSKGFLSDVVQYSHHYLDVVLALLSHMLSQENGPKSIEQANLEIKIQAEIFQDKLITLSKPETACSMTNFTLLLFGHEI